MEFKLKIDMENDDFQNDDGTETTLRKILKQVSEQLAKGFTEGKIFDTNGNKVGKYEMKEKQS